MSFTSINGHTMVLPFAKQEPDLNEIPITPNKDEIGNDSPAPTPTPTPRKRARGKKATTNEDNADEQEQEQEQEQESPSKKTKTKSPSKSPSKRTGGLGPIPTSYEEAGEEDKLLMRMKDENKPWSEITKTLEDMTGTKLGAGLRARYARIKANLVVFDKDDVSILFELKKDIEDKQELEKWQRIAEGIESRSGNKYPISTLQKKFKELSKANGNGVAVKNEE